MDEATVRVLHALRSQGLGGSDEVDDATWDDLDLPLVFQSLNGSASVLGALRMYEWLRRPIVSVDRLAELRSRTALARTFADDPTAALVVERALQRLPRLTPALMEAVWGVRHLPHPGWAPVLLSSLALVTPLAVLLSTNSGLLAVGLAFAVNLAAHFWWGARDTGGTASVDFVAEALRAARTLGDAEVPGFEELKRLTRALRPLARAANEARLPSGVDDLAEYARIFLLTRERRLRACSVLIHQHQSHLRELLERLADLDASVSLGRYLRAHPALTEAAFVPDSTLRLEDLRHPLLGAQAVPTTLTLTGGLLITGSNMSGKSTLLRALGLNVLLAQSLGVTWTTGYRGPLLRISSALRSSDGLQQARSSYLAEALRIGELVARAGPGHLLLLDEPFRGTNSLERVAATVAVLRHLDRRQALVLATTHDLEVTTHLRTNFTLAHFRDGLDDSGLHFDFVLRPGVCTEGNALGLLAHLGYPEEVVRDAKAVAGSPGSYEREGAAPSQA